VTVSASTMVPSTAACCGPPNPSLAEIGDAKNVLELRCLLLSTVLAWVDQRYISRSSANSAGTLSAAANLRKMVQKVWSGDCLHHKE
jgi:hypothetical protein